MTVAISPAELQRMLRLEPVDGLPPWPGIATLLRQAVARWGVSRPATLCRHVRATLHACGYNGEPVSDRVRETLDVLCDLGDVERVWGDAESVVLGEHDDEDVDEPPAVAKAGWLIAPTLPRVVRFGEAVLLSGSHELGVEHRSWCPVGEAASVARWLPGSLAEHEERLEEGGFYECSHAAWLGPPSLLAHLERRGARAQTLDQLWPAIRDEFEGAGGPIADGSRVALLAGPPGGFFGRADERTGRWRRPDTMVDGDFLGVQLGHHGGRQQPIVAHVRGGAVTRATSLFDLDELRWSLLSRGIVGDAREVVRVAGAGLAATCPLPAEVARLQSLCMVRSWRWETPPFVEPGLLAAVVAERYGLLLQE